MPNLQSSIRLSSSRRTWPLIATICLITLFNARFIFSPYSFWLDELATVSMFKLPNDGIWTYLMHDNFPPLYFLIIQQWVALFGLNEISLRLLSLLCVVGAFTVIGSFVYFYGPKRWIWPVFAVTLFGTLPTVGYYANEARPYALLLFLSSLVITSAVAVAKDSPVRRQPFTEPFFHLTALLVSLVHYFGLILVGLIILANILFLKPVQKIRNLLLLAACLVWPVVHVAHSSVLTQAGGNFWITVEPVLGTFKVFFVTAPFLCLLVPLGLIACFGIPRQPRLNSNQTRQQSLRYLGLILGLFVVLMLLLDLHTPLSLPRYYIAIIPVAVLFVVEATQSVFSALQSVPCKAAFVILACFLVAGQSLKAQQRIALKSAPDQDWKTLAAVVRQSHLCRQGCDALGYTDWGHYYFGGLDIRNLDPGASEKWGQYKIYRPLLGFHRAGALIPSLLNANPGVVCLEPKQSIPGSTYLMADRTLVPPDLYKQLIPCLNVSQS